MFGHRSRRQPPRGVVHPATFLGLALTVLAAVVPVVDVVTLDLLAGHIEQGYPEFTDARVNQAVTTYLVLLTSVGVVGAVCWLVAIRGQRAGRPWVLAFAATAWLGGTALGLLGLLARDTSGDTGLPTLLGVLGVLPALPGLVVVVALARERIQGLGSRAGS